MITATTPQSSAPIGATRAWILASRPATLTAAIAPVLVGSALALHRGPLNPAALITTLLGACLLQIASNFANDVFDHEKGADTSERLGPTRAVQAGLLTAAQVKRGLYLVVGLALLVGAYLTHLAGWPIVVIGLSGIVAAIAYTGGPYPLGYHGWGDLFVFLFFGIIAVTGTHFVHTGEVSMLSVLCAVPVGALSTNILVVNNVRDRHTDALARKRTLAVRLGRSATLGQYMAQLGLSYAMTIYVSVAWFHSPWPALPLASLPLAFKTARGLIREEGRALNAVLVESARLVFIFAALFATGLFLATL